MFTNRKCIACALVISLGSISASAQVVRELAGNQLSGDPYFTRVNTFNEDQPVVIGLYGAWLSESITAEVYVVADRTSAEWDLDPTLVDVTNDGSSELTFSPEGIESNIFQLCDPFELEAYPAQGIGVGYDIVIDVDGTGSLTEPDIIDGLEEPGFFVVGDLVQPGQHEVLTFDWTGTEELTKRIWYPAEIAQMGELPLVVISHGWTHEYTYYDHIGEHLASYGFVVMSHWNDVGSGNAAATNSASLSLIANVNHFLANLPDLGGGVLNGHVDHHHMCWTGHSTGGETPVRAYTRLRSGQMSSPQFSWQDVQLISSICPVAFLNGDQCNPYDVNYHQFLGSADTDASGFAGDGYYQPLSMFERATGNRQLTYIHGAGHEVFHDYYSTETWPDSLASGPDLIGKAQVHPIMKSYLLAMCEWYLKGNAAGKDFLTRSYSVFHPMGLDPEVMVTNEYRDAHYALKYVLDDFQSNPDPELSSSGYGVSVSVLSPQEVLMADTDGSFAWNQVQPSNGMTRARYDDDPRCTVFSWGVGGVLWYDISSVPNPSQFDYLSFRAAMPTRHPMNDGIDFQNFYLVLGDDEGNSCVVPVAPFGIISEPYQRDEGGELHLCLEPGDYTVEVEGTAYASETFFEIPGYVDYSTTGSYDFTILETDSCTAVDVFMYDTYGDGWDDGELTVYDALGDTIANGTLIFGFGPEPGAGWQNEFITIRVPLDVLWMCASLPDAGNLLSLGLTFGSFGPGAIAIDDLEFVQDVAEPVINHVAEQYFMQSIEIYPNPVHDHLYLVGEMQDRNDIWITDITGRRVQTLKYDHTHPLYLASLEPGLYHLIVWTAKGPMSTSFIRQ